MAARILIALLLLLAGPIANAQTDPMAEALRKYQTGELPAAQALIDEAVRGDKRLNDPEAWLLRGFIYKDLYKATPPGDEADVLRDEAVASLYTALTLDKAGTYKQNATQAYDFLARTYFNDAARALNEMQDERAVKLFDKYKEVVLRVDAKAQLRGRELEFTNALGTVYTKRFNQDRNADDWFNKAVAAFKAVLVMDPENYGANYNLATLYFNRGVYNIRQITPDNDIVSLEQLQKVSREYFQQALPYMLKAHDMNPTRRETLVGLEGIYYSLQDQESSDKFRLLINELPVQEDR